MPAVPGTAGGVVATFSEDFPDFRFFLLKSATWRQFCSSTSRVVGYEYELPSGSVA